MPTARHASVNQQGPAGRAFSSLFFPLAADFVQAVRAQLELLTDPLQHGALLRVLAIAIGAGDVVRPFPLLAVVDEIIETRRRSLQPLKRLGIDAGPEEREVADLAVHLPP